MNRSLFVATPMYGGRCFGAYVNSMMGLQAEAMRRGIPMQFALIFNESHIDRARNNLAKTFLATNHTHMMFIDSDIEFEANDVLKLLELADPITDRDVICGFYPKKEISWKNVVAAVKAGYADEDPSVLEYFVGNMVFTPAMVPESSQPRPIAELAPLHEGGCGFMMIQRHVFERIANAQPELIIKNQHELHSFTVFFDAKPDPDANPVPHFLTEDYDFCRLVRNCGMKIWLAPWMKLTHHGYYRFIGDIEALGALQVQKSEAA